MTEMTKSYAVKRIAELIEENQLLRKELEQFKIKDTYGLGKFINSSIKEVCIFRFNRLLNWLHASIADIQCLLDPVEYEDYHELLGVMRGYKNCIDYINLVIEEINKEID